MTFVVSCRDCDFRVEYENEDSAETVREAFGWSGHDTEVTEV